MILPSHGRSDDDDTLPTARTTLAARYVRPVLYYETLTQLRDLTPAHAHALPLQFAGCATGPMGSCPLEAVEKHVEALIPADCV